MTVKTVGLDLAKDVFQAHGISENGCVIFNKAIKRAKLLAYFETLPLCTVGMEACGSSHHWGRQLRKLGHDVKLMPAGYVKPYVKVDLWTAKIIADPGRSGVESVPVFFR